MDPTPPTWISLVDWRGKLALSTPLSLVARALQADPQLPRGGGSGAEGAQRQFTARGLKLAMNTGRMKGAGFRPSHARRPRPQLLAMAPFRSGHRRATGVLGLARDPSGAAAAARELDRRAANADDVEHDGTAGLISACAELLDEDGIHGRLGTAIVDRLEKRHRLGRTGMSANPRRREETGWLEELDVGQINALIEERKSHVIQNHIAAGTQKNRVTAMTQFVEFCEIRQTSPIRSAGLIRNMTPAEVAANENLLVDFSVYESWRVTPGVVEQYVSHVINWHIMELGVDLKDGRQFLRLAKVLKGLKKLYPCVKRARLGLKPRDVRAIVRHLARSLRRDGRTPQSRRAYRFILFVCWAFQGLYRGGEGARGADFDPVKHLTCDDPKQVDGGRVLIVRNPELKVRNQQSAVPFPFPVDTEDSLSFGGWFLLQHVYDPLDAGEAPGATPLFRDPTRIDAVSGRAACLSYGDALRSLRLYIGAVMPSADPTLYGLHSLRIGAASALFALNCPPLVLQSLGRWATDIYEIYCRANRGQLVEWTSRLGSAEYETVEELR